MRILHVVSSLDPRDGGPVEALRGLVVAQHEEGLDVRVLATWSRGQDTGLADTLRDAGISIHLVGPCYFPLRWCWGLSSATARCVKAADIVHIHALWEEVQHQAARCAWKLRKPYLIRPCGMLDPWSLGQSRYKKTLYLRWRLRTNLNRAAALHFTTEAERDLTTPLVLQAPAVVEPNGIDAADLDNLLPPGAFRSRYNIPSERPLVLFLGRLHSKKGLDLLLPAFAQAAGRLTTGDPLLVVAGPDANGYQARLKARASELGITGRVLFTGLLLGRDKWAALTDADLFVLPSYQENFGIAVIEALAAGTPVLISDQVNLHDEVRRAAVGCVVSLEPEALTAELTNWLSDADRRRAAGSRGTALVRERYLWRPIARRWADHYARMKNEE